MFCSLQADLARKESALRELEARLEEKDVEALEAKERISGLESRVADLTKRLKGILDSQMRVLVLYDTSVQHLTPPSAERQSIAPGAAGGGLAPEKEKVLVEAVNRLREIEKESHRQIRSMTLEREALKKCVQELTAQVRRAGKKKRKKRCGAGEVPKAEQCACCVASRWRRWRIFSCNWNRYQRASLLGTASLSWRSCTPSTSGSREISKRPVYASAVGSFACTVSECKICEFESLQETGPVAEAADKADDSALQVFSLSLSLSLFSDGGLFLFS